LDREFSVVVLCAVVLKYVKMQQPTTNATGTGPAEGPGYALVVATQDRSWRIH
jgi:hypothetical protein